MGGKIDLVCLAEVDSALAEVKRIVSREAGRTLTAVTADTQSAGRGRSGRSFYSPPGGVYLSLAVWPPYPAAESARLPALVALAVRDAVEETNAAAPDIKWPNDLLIRGKKICGILAEAGHSGDDYFVAIGVGVNVSNRIPPELPNAGSLLDLTGRAPVPEFLAARIITRTIDNVNRAVSDKESLLKRYSSLCVTIGEKIRIESVSGDFCGIAESVDENAALLVRRENGTVETVFSGEAHTEGC